VQIDDGNGGSFGPVTSYPYTTTTLIISSGLSSGLGYRAKYRAENIFGWGDWSPIATGIVMYGKPSAPFSVTVIESGINVEI